MPMERRSRACFRFPPLQVQKRRAGVAAIRGLHAHALYTQAVQEGLCHPVYEPDPEDLEHLSKRDWERAVQGWRRGVEAGAISGQQI